MKAPLESAYQPQRLEEKEAILEPRGILRVLLFTGFVLMFFFSVVDNLVYAAEATSETCESWENSFGESGRENTEQGVCVCQTQDGGYILLSSTVRDLWLVKTNPRGYRVWDRTFGGSKYHQHAQTVHQTRDGGYILLGNTSSYGAGAYDAWVIKTDANGYKQWDRTFGGSEHDWGSAIQQTKDGGYILVGLTRSCGAGESDAWMIKTDAQGNRQWERIFGGSEPDSARSVHQTLDGGFILLGVLGRTFSHSYGYADGVAWLIKTDAQGNKTWERTFSKGDNDEGQFVQETEDGGYILLCSTKTNRARDYWLIKTDSWGHQQWERTFGGNEDDSPRSAQQLHDGGYVLLGSTESFGAGGQDAWLIKTDALGHKQWDRTFGGNTDDWGESVQETEDGGLIFAGTTQYHEKDNPDLGGDAWLVRFCPTSIGGPVRMPVEAIDDTAFTLEDTPVNVDVTMNDSDPSGDLDPSTVTIVTPPVSGTTEVDPTTGTVTYTPNPGFSGTDTFTYKVCDTHGACDEATCTIDVAVAVPEGDTSGILPDENLARMIRNALAKRPEETINEADLESLTELVAIAEGIADLTGLEYAVNLTHLDLYGNEITDISVLAEIPNLTRIDLEGNPLDLSPGSEAMEVIKALLDRGVEVDY